MKKIVFWEPSLSPHKIDLVNQVRKMRPDYEVLYVSAKGISEDRRKLGWSESGYESCLVSPNEEWIKNTFLLNSKDTFHIFSGLKGGKTFKYALKILKKYNANFYILSEPRASEGLKGSLRFLDSTIFEIWYKKNVSSIFAIGVNGPKWFSKVGYDEKKIKLFAYFINNDVFKKLEIRKNNKVKVGFIGRTVKEKGIFDFINLSKLMPDLEFQVIGSSNNLNEIIDNNKNEKNLNILGSVNIAKIPEFLHSLDIVVLPSHTTDDGWGMVISEALMSGCYVITTDKVGSSVLIFRDEIGAVTTIERPDQIQSAIKNAIDNDYLNLSYKMRRKRWALKNLGADNGARYLLNVLENNISELCFFDDDF